MGRRAGRRVRARARRRLRAVRAAARPRPRQRVPAAVHFPARVRRPDCGLSAQVLAENKGDLHLHALKLFPLTLAAEERCRSVLDETGLALGEARDVRGDKVLGRDALADGALLECAGAGRGTALAGGGVVVVMVLARGSARGGGRGPVEDGALGELEELVGGDAHVGGEGRPEHAGGRGRRGRLVGERGRRRELVVGEAGVGRVPAGVCRGEQGRVCRDDLGHLQGERVLVHRISGRRGRYNKGRGRTYVADARFSSVHHPVTRSDVFPPSRSKHVLPDPRSQIFRAYVRPRPCDRNRPQRVSHRARSFTSSLL